MEAAEGNQEKRGLADAALIPDSFPPGCENQQEKTDERQLTQFNAQVESKEGRHGAAADVLGLNQTVGEGEPVDTAKNQKGEGTPAFQLAWQKTFGGQSCDAEAHGDFHPPGRHFQAGKNDDPEHG